jgi:2-polyprenyl-3-methyl-5-hydroxy-6-metoxy-1,4-benzoquinol methylase
MVDKKLHEKYEDIYKDGKEKFFSRFVNGKDISETDKVVWKCIDWSNKKVIDIGCGSGETAAGISMLGAKSVLGIDYSENAIKVAKERHSIENLKFKVDSIETLISSYPEFFSVVISLGTLEHMDDPKEALRKMLRILDKNGKVVLTCPFFINLRGMAWMTLALALDVPMSLTDKHFISPFNIREYLIGTGFELSEVTYFDYERANGYLMLSDMDKRLNNALRDANLSTEGVPRLMEWLQNVVNHESESLDGMNGSSALYIIEREK